MQQVRTLQRLQFRCNSKVKKGQGNDTNINDFVWAGNLQLDKYQGFNAVPAKGCAQ